MRIEVDNKYQHFSSLSVQASTQCIIVLLLIVINMITIIININIFITTNYCGNHYYLDICLSLSFSSYIHLHTHEDKQGFRVLMPFLMHEATLLSA